MQKKFVPLEDNFLQIKGNLMMRSFAVENFQSLKERAEISFSMTKRDESDEWINYTPEEEKAPKEILGTVLGIWGANASGKTSILKALAFLDFFLIDSFESLEATAKIPLEGWFNSIKPTLFEIVFLDEAETLLTYTLELTKERVLSEVLTRRAKGRGGQSPRVFKRVWDKNKKKYDVSFGAIARNHLEKYLQVAIDFRQNTSFVSSFLKHQPASQLKILALNHTNVNENGHISLSDLERRMTKLYFQENTLKEMVITHLKKIDLGVANLLIEKEAVELPPSFKAMIEKDSKQNPELKKLLNETHYSLEAYAHHDVGKGKTAKLPFSKESGGTRALYALLGLTLPILQSGGHVILDEIDNDLHPHLVEYLLELFNGKETNPGKAQLIFTSHNPRFMRRIGKSHIWFAEKKEGVSEIYPLSSIDNVRGDENHEAKYLGGAYGTLPFKE